MINKLYKIDYKKVVEAMSILENNDIISSIFNYIVTYTKRYVISPAGVIMMADKMIYGPHNALYLNDDDIGYNIDDIYNAIIEHNDYFTLLNIQHSGLLFNIMKRSKINIVISIKPKMVDIIVNYIMNEFDEDCDGIVNMFDVEGVSKNLQDRIDVNDDYSKLLKYVVDVLEQKGLVYMFNNNNNILVCVSVLDLGLNRIRISKCIDNENERTENMCPLSIVSDTGEMFVWVRANETLINSVVQYICDKKNKVGF